MAEIGILHGTLESFPQAVLEGLNGYKRGCCCLLTLDALDPTDPAGSGWVTPVVLDLFSRRLPFLNESLYLVWQVSQTKVINDPRLLRLHNRATVRLLADRLGLHTARSFVLPARETFPPLPEEGFVNLKYPVSWKRVLKACGAYPILQSLAFSGEQGSLITDLGTLWRRYNETGSGIQELISPPRSKRIFRLYFVGEVVLIREVDPLTRQLFGTGSVPKNVTAPLIAAARKILAELPLEIASFDLGWDGNEVEYIDLNPDPTLEWWNLGEKDFSLLVEGAIALLKNFIPSAERSAKKTSKVKTLSKKGKR